MGSELSVSVFCHNTQRRADISSSYGEYFVDLFEFSNNVGAFVKYSEAKFRTIDQALDYAKREIISR